jgi:glycosyltransferase involved in cell wall biosynthesis
MLDSITPLLLTCDEEANIGRVLAPLAWARRIVVIDSGSKDGTMDIVRQFPQVTVFERLFDNFANQCNFGLSKVETEWVLSMDADYEISAAVADEIAALRPDNKVSAYRAGFVYRIHGKPLRGTLYPPRKILYRRALARYVNEGHGHRVIVPGETVDLRGVIYHDDRKPLARWFESQKRYAANEADHLLAADPGGLTRIDRLRRAGWPAPLAVAIYVLLVKGVLLDGWAGWHYALQRLIAESMIALEIMDRRCRDSSR